MDSVKDKNSKVCEIFSEENAVLQRVKIENGQRLTPDSFSNKTGYNVVP